MQIAHVIASLDPAAGGPPVVATRLAAAQARMGHQVSIISYRFEGADAAIARLFDGVPSGADVRIDLLPSPDRFERVLATRARSRFGALAGSIDLMHLHGVWESLLPAAAKAAVGCVPYVVAPHGMLDPWSLEQRRWKKRLALALGYRTMLNRAAFIHVLNDDEGKLLAPLSLSPPFRVLPNGVFLEEIAPPADDGTFRARHRIPADRKIVLFLGRLHHKKGLDFLAASLPHLLGQISNTQLVVAGPDGGALPDFLKQIESLQVQSHVSVIGPLYGQERFQAMAEADCFVLPSRQEGFSMAILEAMACRKPVVISPACHFPDVANGAGLIVPLDPQAIATALARVLADEHLAVQMGAQGRALVEGSYTWLRIAERSIQFYADAIAAYRSTHRRAI